MLKLVSFIGKAHQLLPYLRLTMNNHAEKHSAPAMINRVLTGKELANYVLKRNQAIRGII